MAKVDRYEQARRDGMAYALKVAQEKGVTGLEEEIRYRNITKHPIGLEEDYLNQWLDRVKVVLIGALKCATVLTLHDDFDWGNKRITRYLDGFNNRVEAVFENYATMEEFRETIKEEIGIDIFYANDSYNININHHTEAGL